MDSAKGIAAQVQRDQTGAGEMLARINGTYSVVSEVPVFWLWAEVS